VVKDFNSSTSCNLQARYKNSGIWPPLHCFAHSSSSWKLYPWAFLGRQHILQIPSLIFGCRFEHSRTPWYRSPHFKHLPLRNGHWFGLWSWIFWEFWNSEQKRQSCFAISIMLLNPAAILDPSINDWFNLATDSRISGSAMSSSTKKAKKKFFYLSFFRSLSCCCCSRDGVFSFNSSQKKK